MNRRLLLLFLLNVIICGRYLIEKCLILHENKISCNVGYENWGCLEVKVSKPRHKEIANVHIIDGPIYVFDERSWNHRRMTWIRGGNSGGGFFKFTSC
jgi:hypothetical protein